MASQSTGFSIKLFNSAARDTSKNVLISPFSAYEALCMTANGAGGTTLSEMSSVLGSQSNMKALNEHNLQVLKNLNANDKVQMEIANAIYADIRTKFKPEFISLCANYYLAEAKSEPFASPETVKTINDWCARKTHGKISGIIGRLTPQEKMVLLNSVYFKGSWNKAFEKQDTRDEKFTIISGSQVSVPMMHKSLHLGYFAEEKFSAVNIPYAGQKQSMLVFLPNKGVDFKEFTQQFTEEKWKRWLSSFNDRKVDLSMPKYKVEFSTELSDNLKAMGMRKAFGDADFSNMFVGQPGCISRVLQKTYMDVNEEGTEAAAVTAVVMMARASAYTPKPVEFKVDRPFVVALVDNDSNEILFLGSIVDPSSTSKN